MASSATDNYVRCHQAVQLVCAKAIPCILHVLNNWHQSLRVKLKPCITPKTCPTKGKPKSVRGSCAACVGWGIELETVVYPPNSSGSLPWANINPTSLYRDPIEAAKIFVLRLQPGEVYTDIGEFDAASLIMIMMKFSEFHQGDMQMYNTIKNVADIRNHLSHIKVNTNLKLNDNDTDGYFQDINEFITCLSKKHAQCFTQTLKQHILQILQEIRTDKFDIDTCQTELIRMYEDEKGKVTLFPFDIESTVDIDDVFVELEMERANLFKKEYVPLKSYDELFSLKKRPGEVKPVLRVLLNGDAGTGKTTLARKIAYDWAQGIKTIAANVATPLRQFTLLFSLEMRKFDHDMTFVDAVFDQLLPSDSKVSKTGLEKYIVDNADKVAIILDGADEYGGKIERSSGGNLIMDVVCNKMLRNSCVVVTSRPHSTNYVKEFNQYAQVRVNGFNEQSVLKFIGKFFQVDTSRYEPELTKYRYGEYIPKTRFEAFEEDWNSEFGSTFKSDETDEENDVPLPEYIPLFEEDWESELGSIPSTDESDEEEDRESELGSTSSSDESDEESDITLAEVLRRNRVKAFQEWKSKLGSTVKSKETDEENDMPLTGPEDSDGKKTVNAFIKNVFHSPSLMNMVYVPVLLTMLCILWKEARKLPSRLTTLYQEMSHFFIQRWLEKSDLK